MQVVPIFYVGGTIRYSASINQKGVAVTKSGDTRYEAITKCWHDYTYYLYK